MRLHYFQHVWFEDLGIIKDWCEEQNGTISRTAFHEGESIPDVHEIDWLIIMGGPLNIYEEKQYPWLTQEKTFIEKVIKHKKTVLGICLGAQLIADVLGARVYRNKYREIGWFPITVYNDASLFKI